MTYLVAFSMLQATKGFSMYSKISIYGLFSLLFFIFYVESSDLNRLFFTRVYERNSWGSPESRSGNGSTLRNTVSIRAHLPLLFKKYSIKSLLDAPCGDFNWMKKVDLTGIWYIGLDIVQPLITQNSKIYSALSRSFFTVDVINHPLPQVDLILCRDCMQHLLDQDAIALIKNIKASKATYLLASNYPEIIVNKDIDTVYHLVRITYRNLRLPPFNFPQPLEILDEHCEGKTLNFWKIADLPDF